MQDKERFARWRPHPWHGLSPGREPPTHVQAYIEITPFDVVKYEIDKETGYLRVDRPQHTSSLPPTLYGFIPRTYCGTRVAELCADAAEGDGDPLDICVFSEQPINHAEILVNARVIGGIQTIDQGMADDKIIAVLENDNIWGRVVRLDEIPPILIERLMHYFATYKSPPGGEQTVDVRGTYDRAHAEQVICAALADYRATYGQAIS